MLFLLLVIAWFLWVKLQIVDWFEKKGCYSIFITPDFINTPESPLYRSCNSISLFAQFYFLFSIVFLSSINFSNYIFYLISIIVCCCCCCYCFNLLLFVRFIGVVIFEYTDLVVMSLLKIAEELSTIVWWWSSFYVENRKKEELFLYRCCLDLLMLMLLLLLNVWKFSLLFVKAFMLSF